MNLRAPRPAHAAASTRPRLARHILALAACLLAAGVTSVQAQSLMDLYQAARGYDATYLSAVAQAKAAEYKARQAMALRLPKVGLSGNITRQSYEMPVNPLNAPTDNTKKEVGLQARQTLFNQADNATVAQADLSVEIAQADLQNAEQDLIVRLAQAYFDVLNAQDSLAAAQATRTAIGEQLAAAKRNFEVGNVTITDVREAQARADAAAAQEIAATNDLMTKRAALDQLVGRNGVAPKPLMSPVTLPALMPASADEWVAQADSSPNIRKAKLGAQIAKEETSKARAGHLPTVELVGTYGRTRNSATIGTTPAGTTTAKTIGIEATLPLFAGFSTQNQIKEKLASEERAWHDLDAARRAVELGTRTAFMAVQSGLALVKANEAAESSYKLALEATQLGYRVGVRVNLDVLNAQRELYNSQRDLAKSRYDVIVAGLKLRQAAGSLSVSDLQAVDGLLAK